MNNAPPVFTPPASCQCLWVEKNKKTETIYSMYASLYSTTWKIPVYSVYVFHKSKNIGRYDAWYCTLNQVLDQLWILSMFHHHMYNHQRETEAKLIKQISAFSEVRDIRVTVPLCLDLSYTTSHRTALQRCTHMMIIVLIVFISCSL